MRWILDDASQMRARRFAPWLPACPVIRVRWTPGGDSSDIEDRRSEGGGGGFNLGGFGGMHLGIGGTLLFIVLSLIFKVNLFSVLGGGGGITTGPDPSATERPLSNSTGTAAEQREVEFVKFVLNDVQ